MFEVSIAIQKMFSFIEQSIQVAVLHILATFFDKRKNFGI